MLRRPASSQKWHLNRLEPEGVDDDTGALVEYGQECQLLLLTARNKYVSLPACKSACMHTHCEKAHVDLFVCMYTQPIAHISYIREKKRSASHAAASAHLIFL